MLKTRHRELLLKEQSQPTLLSNPFSPWTFHLPLRLHGSTSKSQFNFSIAAIRLRELSAIAKKNKRKEREGGKIPLLRTEISGGIKKMQTICLLTFIWVNSRRLGPKCGKKKVRRDETEGQYPQPASGRSSSHLLFSLLSTLFLSSELRTHCKKNESS